VAGANIFDEGGFGSLSEVHVRLKAKVGLSVQG
jgi:hypothetical protein